MLNPDTPGEAFFQIHPAFQDEVSMSEMLDVAEEKLPKYKRGRQKGIDRLGECG